MITRRRGCPRGYSARAPPGRDASYWHVQLAAVGSGSGRAGSPELEGLVVRTVPVPDPGDLVGQLPGTGPLAWIRRGEGLVGWGEVARVTVPAGQDRFTAADKWLRALLDGVRVEDRVGAPGCGPVAFGSFTFDPTSEGSVLILPQVILGRRADQAWLTTVTGQPPAPPSRPGPRDRSRAGRPCGDPGRPRADPLARRQPDRTPMGAGGRGRGAAHQGRPAAEGGAGPRPVRVAPGPDR